MILRSKFPALAVMGSLALLIAVLFSRTCARVLSLKPEERFLAAVGLASAQGLLPSATPHEILRSDRFQCHFGGFTLQFEGVPCQSPAPPALHGREC